MGRSRELITLLGHRGAVTWSRTWSRDEKALTVEMPGRKPCAHAFVLAIR